MNLWPWKSKDRVARDDALTEAMESNRRTADELSEMLQRARVRKMIEGLLPDPRRTARDTDQ